MYEVASPEYIITPSKNVASIEIQGGDVSGVGNVVAENAGKVRVTPCGGMIVVEGTAELARIRVSDMSERSNILLSLEREQSRRFRQHFIGRTVEVLMEEPAVIDGKSYMTGHTKEYVKVALETQENLSNRIITGRAEGFMGESMLIMNRQG